MERSLKITFEPMDMKNIAIRVASFNLEAAKKNKKNQKKTGLKSKKPIKVSQPKVSVPVTAPETEYSCRAEISFSVDFEGNVSKDKLVRAMKREVMAALGSAVTSVSRSFQISASNVLVKPIAFECAINDQSSMEDMDELGEAGSEIDDPNYEDT
jgi:hypothetical protein